MKKSQINNQIAKFCGWKPNQTWYISIDGGETALMIFETKEQAIEKLRLATPCECHADCDQPEIWCEETPTPNYYECLNAMQTAEKSLNFEQFQNYIFELMEIRQEPMLATSQERAEALLRVIGKTK